MHQFVDARQHTLRIAQHVVVPESQDPDAELAQCLRSFVVVGLCAFFTVLLAVEFDGELERIAVEIHNVIADRMLAAEFHAELVVAQQPP